MTKLLLAVFFGLLFLGAVLRFLAWVRDEFKKAAKSKNERINWSALCFRGAWLVLFVLVVVFLSSVVTGQRAVVKKAEAEKSAKPLLTAKGVVEVSINGVQTVFVLGPDDTAKIEFLGGGNLYTDFNGAISGTPDTKGTYRTFGVDTLNKRTIKLHGKGKIRAIWN